MGGWVLMVTLKVFPILTSECDGHLIRKRIFCWTVKHLKMRPSWTGEDLKRSKCPKTGEGIRLREGGTETGRDATTSQEPLDLQGAERPSWSLQRERGPTDTLLIGLPASRTGGESVSVASGRRAHGKRLQQPLTPVLAASADLGPGVAPLRNGDSVLQRQ